MARAAHPDAMRPHAPGRTRTAPPRLPDQFPFAGRYRPYLLFGATGLLYLLMGFLVLRCVWALGRGAEAWTAALATFRNPLYIAFHALALAGVVFVGVRFFRLFPKAQPPQIGPLKPPPAPLLQGLLYVAWIAVAGGLALVLGGGLLA